MKLRIYLEDNLEQRDFSYHYKVINISQGGLFVFHTNRWKFRQYDLNNLDKTNICSGAYLQQELKERVFQNIEIIEVVK